MQFSGRMLRLKPAMVRTRADNCAHRLSMAQINDSRCFAVLQSTISKKQTTFHNVGRLFYWSGIFFIQQINFESFLITKWIQHFKNQLFF